MLKIGPNPYGLTCSLGLQGGNHQPLGLDWYVGLAEKMHARSIEFHGASLLPLPADSLSALHDRLQSSAIEPVISGPWPLTRITEAIPLAKALGARTVRTHLSPILCGARAALGRQWSEMVDDLRLRLIALGPIFSDVGLVLAIENHQDFGSRELLEFCMLGGPGIGICLDTGNPLAVAEAPLDFARRVAPKVTHLHLKDYRAQATPEGFRLVRCAIGDGAIPLQQIADILGRYHANLTATLEPGALEARHVKLLTADWWVGYPPRPEEEKASCLEASRINALPEDADFRTPWEQEASIEDVCRFEQEQMMKSIDNMRRFGWVTP